MFSPRAQLRWITALALAAAVALPLSAQDDGADSSYSYVLAIQGTATLVQGDTDTRTAVEPNAPILVGDRLWVDPSSRVGLLLSDGNRLHADGDAEIVFDRLAFSPDTGDRQTQLSLTSGRLVLNVDNLWQVDEATRLDTANATLYLQDAGEYFVVANNVDYTEIVVRTGFAEVLTRRGSSVVRSGESLLVQGADWPQVNVAAAPARDPFEDWVQGQETLRLSQAATVSDTIDPTLRYQAADLDEHGEWIEVQGTRVWRPMVAVSWRPYWYGRWAYTPSGLYWVSYDPWSSITFHYGTWDWAVGFGWVWYPGRVYSPAHVYWYWGPSYVGWVPWGYYGHYYQSRYASFGFGFSFGFGTYGWAGGRWGYYDRWTFCQPRYLGRHDQHRHHADNRRARDTLQTPDVPRGILTNDTRGLGPDTWTKADSVEKTLLRRLRDERHGATGEVPDVTPFVAREERLPPSLERRFAEAPIPAKPTKLAAKPGVGPSAGSSSAELQRFAPRPPRGDTTRGSAPATPPRASQTVPGKPAKDALPTTVKRPAPRPPTRSTASTGDPTPRLQPVRPAPVVPRARGAAAKPTDKVAPRPVTRSTPSPGAIRQGTSPRESVRPPVVRREPTTIRMKPPTAVKRSQAADSARRVLEPIRSRPTTTTPRALAPPRPVPRTAKPPSTRGGATGYSSRPTPVPRTSRGTTVVRPTTPPSRSSRPAKVAPASPRPAPRSTPTGSRSSVRRAPSPVRPSSSLSGSRPTPKAPTVKSRPVTPRRTTGARSSSGSSRRGSGQSSASSSRSRAGGSRSSSKPSKPRH